MNSIRLGLALLAASLISTTAVVRAVDWTTTDGKTYEDVKLIHLDPDSVTILYAEGGARIPLDKLPPKLQQRFGYDPDAAKAAADARAKEAVVNARALQAEMNQASEMHQAGPEPVAVPDSSTPIPSDTAAMTGAIAPTPVFNTGTHHFIDEIATSAASLAADPNDASHHSVDEATQAAAAMRRDLSDPAYHTMGHMFYTVKSLGPDPTDTTHHTINETTGAMEK